MVARKQFYGHFQGYKEYILYVRETTCNLNTRSMRSCHDIKQNMFFFLYIITNVSHPG